LAEDILPYAPGDTSGEIERPADDPGLGRTRALSDADLLFLSEEGLLDAAFEFVPGTKESSYLDYVYGRDPNAANELADSYINTGKYAQGKGREYGEDLYDIGRDAYDVGLSDADALQTGGYTNADMIRDDAAGLSPYARASSDTLFGYGQSLTSAGNRAAGYTEKLGAENRDRFLANAALGPSSAAADQLSFGADRALSAQRALSGTVRGLGSAQNTVMSDALIEGNYANQQDILAAEQEAAYRERKAAATQAGYSTELGAFATADAQRRGAYQSAGAAYSGAAKTDLDANQFGIQTGDYANDLELGTYIDAANTAGAAGAFGQSTAKQGADIINAGAGKGLAGAAGAGRVRESEMDIGLGFEDALTAANAGALNQSSQANLSVVKDRAAKIKGYADAATTLATNWDSDT
jgi:hypothetical protein